MSTLEYTIYGIKRGWRVSRTFVFCGAFAALVVNGIFAAALENGTSKILALVMLPLWALFFGLKAHSRFLGSKLQGSMAQRADLEIGLMLILATHAGIQMAGGLASAY